MLLFWSLAGLMLGLSLLVVLRPLLRSEAAATPDDNDYRLAMYRSRLAEIEQEVAAGALSEEEAQAVRLETERELLRAVGPGDARAPALPARRAAVILLIVMPAVSLLLYLQFGEPSLVEMSAPQHTDRASLERRVEQLATRLRDDPDDAFGWRLLARSYAALERNDDAVAALEHIHQAHVDDVEIMVELAQALATAHGGRFAGRPVSLLESALAQDPAHQVALWLAGTAAIETGEPDRAVAYWKKLITLMDSVETADEVRRLIARVQGGEQGAPAPSDAQRTDSEPFSLRVKVELSPEFAGENLTDAVVFVTARSSDGSPMPLAAVRLAAKDLPLDVTLDETTLMIPDTRFTDFDRLDLTARISRSGQAERQSGDLIGELLRVDNKEETVRTIIIDSRVP